DLFDPALFRAPERARQEFETICARASDEFLRVLHQLLSESPDPDQALSLLARLASEDSGELLRLLDRNRVLLHHTLLIFGHSYWLGETILQHPHLLRALDREKNLERSLGREDYRENFARLRSRTTETDTSHLLARFKRREYVRIALRDVLGISTL